MRAITTRDGYAMRMPRFRVRRLRGRARDVPRWRSMRRTIDLLVERARRTGGRPRAPVFATRLGMRPLTLITRLLAPHQVELLYIRCAPRPR